MFPHSIFNLPPTHSALLSTHISSLLLESDSRGKPQKHSVIGLAQRVLIILPSLDLTCADNLLLTPLLHERMSLIIAELQTFNTPPSSPSSPKLPVPCDLLCPVGTMIYEASCKVCVVIFQIDQTEQSKNSHSLFISAD